MTERQIETYMAVKRMAEDPSTSQNERDVARRHAERLEAEMPELRVEAARRRRSDDDAHVERPRRPRANEDAWDAVADFLRKVTAGAQRVGQMASLHRTLDRNHTIDLSQAKTGRMTVKLTLETAAVDALLDAPPADREAAVLMLAGSIRTQMLEFLQP